MTLVVFTEMSFFFIFVGGVGGGVVVGK